MTTEQIVAIRAADKSDLAALSALAARTWKDAFGAGISADNQAADFDARRSENYFRAVLARSDSALLVAETERVLVGYAQFGPPDVPEAQCQPGDMGLQRVYVETALQGRGIGRRLVDAVLRDPQMVAAPRVFLQVWEQNERAIALYTSFGFRRAGTVNFTIGTMETEELLMVRQRQPRT